MQSSQDTTKSLLEKYYAAFNVQDTDALLDLLDREVVHDLNEGQREVGKAAFVKYWRRQNASYQEHIFDIEIMTNRDGSRAAAEYTVLGVYRADQQGLPPGSGQNYRLPGGAFFEIRDGRITRVSSYYNVQKWLTQVA